MGDIQRLFNHIEKNYTPDETMKATLIIEDRCVILTDKKTGHTFVLEFE